jgi:LacI family transcriptional regulator
VVGANQLLTGVLEAMHTLGVSVGRDVAIVSTDDVELTRFYQPPITCVVRDVYKAGQVAAELALEQLADDDAPARSVILPTWLVKRESTTGMTVSAAPASG